MNIATSNPLARSVRETAHSMGLAPNTIWNLLKEGRIPRIRVGRRTLVRVSDAEAFMESCAETAPQKEEEAK